MDVPSVWLIATGSHIVYRLFYRANMLASVNKVRGDSSRIRLSGELRRE
jgi:hypothetical protein